MIINNIEGDLITVGNSKIFLSKKSSDFYLVVNDQFIKLSWPAQEQLIIDIRDSRVRIKYFDRNTFEDVLTRNFYNALYGRN